jgi:hypothetical protein
MRRGLNYHGTNPKKIDTENEEIQRERAAIEREQTLKQAADVHAANEAEKKTKKKKEEDVPPPGDA